MLNKNEIRAVLQLLRDKYGPGYASDEDVVKLHDVEVSVAQLQVKLSVMLEVAARAETAR